MFSVHLQIQRPLNLRSLNLFPLNSLLQILSLPRPRSPLLPCSALPHPGRTLLPLDTPLQNPAQPVLLHRNRLHLPRNQNRSPGHLHHKSLRRGIPAIAESILSSKSPGLP